MYLTHTDVTLYRAMDEAVMWLSGNVCFSNTSKFDVV